MRWACFYFGDIAVELNEMNSTENANKSALLNANCKVKSLSEGNNE